MLLVGEDTNASSWRKLCLAVGSCLLPLASKASGGWGSIGEKPGDAIAATAAAFGVDSDVWTGVEGGV